MLKLIVKMLKMRNCCIRFGYLVLNCVSLEFFGNGFNRNGVSMMSSSIRMKSEVFFLFSFNMS